MNYEEGNDILLTLHSPVMLSALQNFARLCGREDFGGKRHDCEKICENEFYFLPTYIRMFLCKLPLCLPYYFFFHSADTPHSVGLLWTGDQPDTDVFTWQYTTLAIDIQQCHRWDSNPQSQQPKKQAGAEPRLSPHSHWGWRLPYCYHAVIPAWKLEHRSWI